MRTLSWFEKPVLETDLIALNIFVVTRLRYQFSKYLNYRWCGLQYFKIFNVLEHLTSREFQKCFFDLHMNKRWISYFMFVAISDLIDLQNINNFRDGSTNRLGKGVRKVISSCALWSIRSMEVIPQYNISHQKNLKN